MDEKDGEKGKFRGKTLIEETEEENLGQRPENEQLEIRKKQRMIWDDWWKGARKKDISTNPQTQQNPKERKNRSGLKKIEKKKVSVEKKKRQKHNKNGSNGIQISVREMIGKFEKKNDKEPEKEDDRNVKKLMVLQNKPDKVKLLTKTNLLTL